MVAKALLKMLTPHGCQVLRHRPAFQIEHSKSQITSTVLQVLSFISGRIIWTSMMLIEGTEAEG
ncbi:MAG: hypothetical protein WA815_17955, partial [Terracidiphilus sp.]